MSAPPRTLRCGAPYVPAPPLLTKSKEHRQERILLSGQLRANDSIDQYYNSNRTVQAYTLGELHQIEYYDDIMKFEGYDTEASKNRTKLLNPLSPEAQNNKQLYMAYHYYAQEIDRDEL